MKKFYFLVAALVIASISANAQNLVTNGDLEQWTDGAALNFEPNPALDYINHFTAQESVKKHGGLYSIKQQSQPGTADESDTQYLEYADLIPVIAGHTYTISYWYLDDNEFASTRFWSSWLNSSNAPLGTALQSNVQLAQYSTNSPDWKNRILTVTAPTGAASLRLQLRTYRQSMTNAGGYIYYDDFVMTDNATAGVNDNMIAGLTMYPNPLSGTTLNITTAANADKTVAIYDIVGKQVLSAKVTNNTVNVSALTAGIYMVTITEEGKTATKKLVVK